MNKFELTNKRYTLIDGLIIPLKFAPFHVVIIILHKIVAACIPAINIGVTANFINTAIAIVDKTKPLSSITRPLILVVVIIAFNLISGNLINFINVKLSICLRKILRESFVLKRAKLSYEHIENSQTWDLILRAATTPEDKIIGVFNNLLGIASLIISITGVLAVLMVQIWWAGIVIVAVAVPLIRLSIKSGKKSYEANREVSKIQRKYQYLSKILTDRENSQERSIFGFSKKLNERYKSEYERARKFEYKVQKKWYIKTKAGGVANALISICVLFVLINPVITGAITVGMFISFVSSIFGMTQYISWQLSDSMDNLAQNKEYMKDLTDFAALSEQEGGESLPSKNVPEFKSLEFKDVYFKYPDTENYILNGLSFKIEKDKHYSFVGINGAGKTTITKLITGLYRDYQGEIILNSKELHEYSLADLKGIFCSVFQDFAKYYISLKENIAIGSPYGAGDKEIEAALRLIGLTDVAASLPDDIDTPLGKIREGGVDISGGEWQRIAMARAIVNPAQVTILDEPTAALDPIGESEMYEKFRDISRGRTTIFISHRLASTKFSDIIYVLNNGKVCESGSYDELMKQKGVYSAMFESQRSWYV